MVGQPLRSTACTGDNVYVLVAVVIARESDHGAIGREQRIGFISHPRSKPPGVTAVAGSNPQIASIVEDDLSLAYRRLTQ